MNLDAYGLPAPKGSPQVVTRDGAGRVLPFPRVLSDTPATVRWAKAVAGTALALAGKVQPLFTEKPLRIVLEFRLPRPDGHLASDGIRLRRSAPRLPSVKPDLDKLVRATLDPLEGIVYDNDSRICEITARKRYARQGEPTGAAIFVEPITDEQLALWTPAP